VLREMIGLRVEISDRLDVSYFKRNVVVAFNDKNMLVELQLDKDTAEKLMSRLAYTLQDMEITQRTKV